MSGEGSVRSQDSPSSTLELDGQTRVVTPASQFGYGRQTSTALSSTLTLPEEAHRPVLSQRDQEKSMNGAHTPTAESIPSSPLPTTIDKETSTSPIPPSNPEPENDPNLVEFDGPDDPYHPQNWGLGVRLRTTALYGCTTMAAAFGSSVFSAAEPEVEEYFGISSELGTLGLSLYILGWTLGPLCFAPLSELYGRRIAILPPYIVYAVFTAGTGASQTYAAVLVTRFLGGICASAPVAIVGGAMADIWTPAKRGVAIVFYSWAVVGGPFLGPLIGGALIVSGHSWRWTMWFTCILAGGIAVLVFFFVPESYPPVLLVRKAKALRKSGENPNAYANHESAGLSFHDIVVTHLGRPLRMLFLEPTVTSMAVYASFCYGLLYMLFGAFPIAYQEIRGWNPVVGALPFLAVFVGVIIAGIGTITLGAIYYRSVAHKRGGAVPEGRLLMMMIGAVLLPAGMFFWGWTSNPSISWVPNIIAAGLIGCGFISIFQQAINYLIDAYTIYAASAVAANTVLRSLLAAAFPLFADQMFHNLGVPWAASLIAFISVGMIPIPFLFLVYGERIRGMSKLCRQIKEEEERRGRKDERGPGGDHLELHQHHSAV
ncbi:hypothetical protein YB2330_002890 [Saitoella coloradoensis]